MTVQEMRQQLTTENGSKTLFLTKCFNKNPDLPNRA
jgi:hypothetical protein